MIAYDDTLSGEYLDQFPARRIDPPKQVHRLDRQPGRALRIWTALAIVAWLVVAARLW